MRMRVSRWLRNPHSRAEEGFDWVFESSGEGVAADRAEGAEVARALRVFRSEAEVAGGDARGGRADLRFNACVIGCDFPGLAAANVEQHQARVGRARQKAA